MREWLLLAATFAPLLILGLLERSDDEAPAWMRAIGLGWFIAGALVLGWYDGWVKRALVGVLIFIPLMAAFIWWSGAVPSGWPTVITILLIAGSTVTLALLGLKTGWFEEVLSVFRRPSANDSRARGE
jgi:hypothetical protein